MTFTADFSLDKMFFITLVFGVIINKIKYKQLKTNDYEKD